MYRRGRLRRSRQLDAVLEDRAGLVVAHRLRQAAAADRVPIVENGRIVESRTPDKLPQTEGRFAELSRERSGGA